VLNQQALGERAEASLAGREKGTAGTVCGQVNAVSDSAVGRTVTAREGRHESRLANREPQPVHSSALDFPALRRV
jgi:hypothetical protein